MVAGGDDRTPVEAAPRHTGRADVTMAVPGRTAMKKAPVTQRASMRRPLARGASTAELAWIGAQVRPGPPRSITSTVAPRATQNDRPLSLLPSVRLCPARAATAP